jgi:hypothetical protein
MRRTFRLVVFQHSPELVSVEAYNLTIPVDSVRVDISYRPLRIGWAILAGDIAGFRSAVRMSYALWGGRFNPIIVVDREEQAKSLVDLFRVDVIIPIGDSAAVGFPLDTFGSFQL